MILSLKCYFCMYISIRGTSLVLHILFQSILDIQTVEWQKRKKKLVKRVLEHKNWHQKLDSTALSHGLGRRFGSTAAHRWERLITSFVFSCHCLASAPKTLTTPRDEQEWPSFRRPNFIISELIIPTPTGTCRTR